MSSGDDTPNGSSKSVIVVADAHLGAKGEVSSRPIVLSSFIRWVKSLEERPATVNLGDWGEGEVKTLRAPRELILLGDILELWDATDRSIDFCSRSIMESLGETFSKKTYIIGNHDHDLTELIWGDLPGEAIKIKAIDRGYPMGKSQITFFDGIYPTQTNPGHESKPPVVVTLRVGDENYLFLHGHQFDKLFTVPSWRWMSDLRAAALAFGSYTWVFVILFSLDLIFTVSSRAIDVHGFAVLALLALISTPFLVIKFARKVWNRIRTRKYDREGAILGFANWWDRFSRNRAVPRSGLNVVYGHTHLTDFIDSPDDIKRILGKETTFKGHLLNIPAWSKDLSEGKVEELQAVFLYIDEGGNWFFGWDYEKQQPFLIPKGLIKERRDGKCVVKDDGTASALGAIGWPKLLIDEWRKPSQI